MISVGIIGGTGYVAGELLRIASGHPNMQIDFVFSQSKAGVPVGKVHADLFNSPLIFCDYINPNVDAVFLCTGHGKSKAFLEVHPFSSDTLIIDLSNDFRLKASSIFGPRTFHYGLVDVLCPEESRSKSIANPGCFATAIQLALAPIAGEGVLAEDVHINGITGSTGAGAGLSETSHFSYRNNNVSTYKVFSHQHEAEAVETLRGFQPDWKGELHFIPMRGNFTRGIMVTAYQKTSKTAEEWIDIFTDFYANSPFVYVSREGIHLKQVVNTNWSLLHVDVVNGKLIITSAIDNLLKGAAGQAVENMNLHFGLPQSEGLHFKANHF